MHVNIDKVYTLCHHDIINATAFKDTATLFNKYFITIHSTKTKHQTTKGRAYGDNKTF